MHTRLDLDRKITGSPRARRAKLRDLSARVAELEQYERRFHYVSEKLAQVDTLVDQNILERDQLIDMLTERLSGIESENRQLLHSARSWHGNAREEPQTTSSAKSTSTNGQLSPEMGSVPAGSGPTKERVATDCVSCPQHRKDNLGSGASRTREGGLGGFVPTTHARIPSSNERTSRTSYTFEPSNEEPTVSSSLSIRDSDKSIQREDGRSEKKLVDRCSSTTGVTEQDYSGAVSKEHDHDRYPPSRTLSENQNGSFSDSLAALYEQVSSIRGVQEELQKLFLDVRAVTTQKPTVSEDKSMVTSSTQTRLTLVTSSTQTSLSPSSVVRLHNLAQPSEDLKIQQRRSENEIRLVHENLQLQGDLLELRSRLTAAQTQLHHVQSQKTAEEGIMDDLLCKISGLEANLRDKDALIAERERALAERSAFIKLVEKELEHFDTDKNGALEQIRALTSEARKLQNDLATVNARAQIMEALLSGYPGALGKYRELSKNLYRESSTRTSVRPATVPVSRATKSPPRAEDANLAENEAELPADQMLAVLHGRVFRLSTELSTANILLAEKEQQVKKLEADLREQQLATANAQQETSKVLTSLVEAQVKVKKHEERWKSYKEKRKDAVREKQQLVKVRERMLHDRAELQQELLKEIQTERERLQREQRRFNISDET